MITRRNLFQAAAGVSIAAAVGPTAPLPPAALHGAGVLTFADLLRAERMLSRQSIPAFAGQYRMFL